MAAPLVRPAGRVSTWRAIAEGWRLARPFWRARRERRAWGLLAAVVALTLVIVGLNVLFSAWNNRFYDTLQNHDMAGFWRELGVFAALAAAFIVAAVYRQYLQGVLVIQWRTWLTQHLLGGWLAPGTAYRLGAGASAPVDNPDQRIAEDARGFVATTLDLSLGLLNAGVTLVSFVGILWRLSGALPLPWAAGLQIPGYMVFVAVLYSLAGSWLVHRLGLPLIALNFQQQKVEADLRYALVQVRDHAEAIALARGEPAEHRRIGTRFEAVRANWTGLIRATKRLTWFSAGYGQLANVFPILAAAPRYFAGALQLGGLMQTAQAFGQVQGAMSWFIDAYPRLAEWRATVDRLSGFDTALVDETRPTRPRGLVRATGRQHHLDIEGLVVVAPDGREILRVDKHRLEAGRRILISGPSGIGKSSLLRALAGLWQSGTGSIVLPADASLMFVPQRPYLPPGTLADALAYPAEAGTFDRAALLQALDAVGLGRYAGQIDAPLHWAQVLSPGEQQRVHFARVLLQRPDWVFLDEATSALDEPAESLLYETLQRTRPGLTIVSVGHRSRLRELHDCHWDVRPVALASPAPAARHAPGERAVSASVQCAGPDPTADC